MDSFKLHIQMGRIAKEINMSETARRVGITPQYYADIEKKGVIPSEEVIQKLVDVLELDEVETFRLADKLPPRVIEEAKQNYFGQSGE